MGLFADLQQQSARMTVSKGPRYCQRWFRYFFVPRPFFKVMEGIFNGAHDRWHHQSETEEG
jgi:hypothetical protein